MALDQSALLERLEGLKLADVDYRVRTATERLYQGLIKAELTAVIGAAPHERTSERTAQRNGSRPRTLTTTAGDLLGAWLCTGGAPSMARWTVDRPTPNSSTSSVVLCSPASCSAKRFASWRRLSFGCLPRRRPLAERPSCPRGCGGG